MKKLILGSILVAFSLLSFGNPSFKQKLYYTCKVWGFVKYYHSRVSVCAVNWDSVLLHCLPLVKAAVTKNDFNNALDTMLIAAGPMALTTSPSCDTVPSERKRNLNFGWINDTMLRADVQTILDTIKNNFRPHTECWVENNPHTNSYAGWLVFPNDSLMLDSDMGINYPNEWERILLLCKQWNIVNYFAFNDYVQNQPWDSALAQNAILFDTAQSDFSFYLAFMKLTSNMDDGHTGGLTYDYNNIFPYGGTYNIQLVLKYIPNNYVVVKSAVTGISVGDKILSINGLTTKQWEDSLRPYVSASDTASFRNAMCSYMLANTFNASIAVTYVDSLNNTHTLSTNSNLSYYDSWFYDYYPNDSLGSTQWTDWNNCNIGYVNVGNIQDTGSNISTMYSTLQSTNAIIFDIRNYPSSVANALFHIANLMFPNSMNVTKLAIPNVTYPGTWTWQYNSFGTNGNPNPYTGKVIILFNEVTGSAAEYDCMVLGAMANSLKIGNQTQGADGNITGYRISLNTSSGFTTLGVFYPNGDSTQRIGIKPDSLVYPTQIGIRHHRDELLEKAFEVVGCPLSTKDIISKRDPGLKVFPNPVDEMLYLSVSQVNFQDVTLTVTDATGRVVIEQSLSSIIADNIYGVDVQKLSPGMYFIKLQNENNQCISKFIKQ